MAKDRDVAPEGEPDSFANFYPHILGRDRALGKDGAAGIGFRLKAEHAPDIAALRIGEVPPNHLRNVVDVSPRHGETERVFEEQPGLRAKPQGEIRESLPDRVQVGLALNPADRIAVAACLSHVYVDG